MERFQNDPSCRVFLATDAGSVGLNLQHAAATIINMDLPWNPAVLEQRIGRVYRLGQQRTVQVINLVAKGVIEEQMLSLLAFKHSLAQGVLDGGSGEIFLQGSRLSQFMESVEEVTAELASAEVSLNEEPEPAASQIAEDTVAASLTPISDETTPHPTTTKSTPPTPTQTAPSADDPWAPLLDVGLKLVETLMAPTHTTASASKPAWIETDPGSGQNFIKFPIPNTETMTRLQEVATVLLQAIANRPS